MADDQFEADQCAEFCATRMAGFDELVLEYVESPDFDRLLVDSVTSAFPAHDHYHFVPHYRGLRPCTDEGPGLSRPMRLRCPQQ